jgi:hypothetical protein
MLSSRSEPRTIKRANCEPREPYLASLCSDRSKAKGLCGGPAQRTSNMTSIL